MTSDDPRAQATYAARKTLPVVYGIDISLTSTGVARLFGIDQGWTQAVTSTGRRADGIVDRAVRIETVASRVLQLVTPRPEELSCPHLIVVEAPSYGALGGSTHDRSGLWWTVVGALIARGWPVAAIPPTTLKVYATGQGRAFKEDMVDAARQVWPWFDGTHDEADGLWLAAAGRRYLGHPVDPDQPRQAEALTTAAWPIDEDAA